MGIRHEVYMSFEDDGNGESYGCERWGAAYGNVADSISAADYSNDAELNELVGNFAQSCADIAQKFYALDSDFRHNVAWATPYDSLDALLSMSGDVFAHDYEDEDMYDEYPGFGEPCEDLSADSLFARGFLDWGGCHGYGSDMYFTLSYGDELINRILQTVSTVGFEREANSEGSAGFGYYREGARWGEFLPRLIELRDMASEVFSAMLEIEKIED